jgi:MoaA/NifB/PqqE/SkfB family radical SAM enzyme
VTTFHEKLSLLKGLLTGEVAYNGPFYVSVDLTRRCNLNCRYCRYHSSLSEFPSPVDKPLSDIPLEMLRKLLRELETFQTREITFAGEGEPLLYPHFFDAISAAKAAGMHVNVVTNGTLLTEDVIRRLVDLRLDLLTISLWASSEKEYERLYPGTKPIYFNKVLEALKRVTNVKAKEKSQLPALRLHRPISKDNFRTVEVAFDQAYAAGCNQLTVAPIYSLKGEVTSYTLSSSEEKDLFFSLFRMKRHLKKYSIGNNIDVTMQIYRIGEAVWKTLPCYGGWLHSRIRIDGTVFPCGRCSLPLGNLSEMNFHEIWNGEAYRSFRKVASTRKGLASMKDHCLCGYCCHIRNNIRVHRIYRWIAPFATVLSNRGHSPSGLVFERQGDRRNHQTPCLP